MAPSLTFSNLGCMCDSVLPARTEPSIEMGAGVWRTRVPLSMPLLIFVFQADLLTLVEFLLALRPHPAHLL